LSVYKELGVVSLINLLLLKFSTCSTLPKNFESVDSVTAFVKMVTWFGFGIILFGVVGKIDSMLYNR